MPINYRNLIEGAKVIAPPDPDVVARLKAAKKQTGFTAAKGQLEFKKDGKRLDYIFQYKNKWVIDTDHAADRIVQRGQLTAAEMKKFFRSMIDRAPKKGRHVLYFSKSLNQGMVIDYRRDYKKIDDQKHFIIITFLPRGKRDAKKGTDTVLMEYLKEYHVIVCD